MALFLVAKREHGEDTTLSVFAEAIPLADLSPSKWKECKFCFMLPLTFKLRASFHPLELEVTCALMSSSHPNVFFPGPHAESCRSISSNYAPLQGIHSGW